MSETATTTMTETPASGAGFTPPSSAAPPGVSSPPAPGGAPSDWRASLPAEIREAPQLAKFKDPTALAQSYTALEGLLGRKGLVMPTETDPPEVHARFRAALGVPEAPEGYELKAPEGVPADVWKPEAATEFAGVAHKLGLTPTQAQGLAAWYAQSQAAAGASSDQQLEAARTETEQALRGEWGAAYPAKLEQAKRALAEFGGEDLPAYLQSTGLGNNPALVRAFARIGEAIGEDKPAGMGTGGGRGLLTPAEAAAELQRLRAPGGPYWDRRHPEHKHAVQRALDLEQMRSAG